MTADPTYLPGASKRANDQVRIYEATDGAERWDMRGVPVIILSTRGRRSGAIRKIPLMRVTDGERYAVIASLGGAPSTRSGISTCGHTPRSRCRTRRSPAATSRTRPAARSVSGGGRGR